MCWCSDVFTVGKLSLSVLTAMWSQYSLLCGTTAIVITTVCSVNLLLHGTVYGPWVFEKEKSKREIVSADDIDFSEGNCI